MPGELRRPISAVRPSMCRSDECDAGPSRISRLTPPCHGACKGLERGVVEADQPASDEPAPPPLSAPASHRSNIGTPARARPARAPGLRHELVRRHPDRRQIRSARAQTATRSTSTSGWNWTPRCGPWRTRPGRRAIARARPRRAERASARCATSAMAPRAPSSSTASTGTSRSRACQADPPPPPSASDSACPPKHRPSTGTPASTAARKHRSPRDPRGLARGCRLLGPERDDEREVRRGDWSVLAAVVDHVRQPALVQPLADADRRSGVGRAGRSVRAWRSTREPL